MSYTNSVSRAYAVTTSYTTPGFTGKVLAIQNNTSGDLSVKLGDGDGALVIPSGVFFEPQNPLSSVLSVKSTVAGSITLVY